MRFEKWQALGNDYVILEADQVPAGFGAPMVRRLCDRHLGVGADGILVLDPPTRPGFVAALRIFNPDGSEAELSGNGARQALMYLHRRGRVAAGSFSIETAAGELRATVRSPTTCTVDMGRARLRSPAFPSGGPDGSGTLEAGGRQWRFQHVSIGNPQCAIAVPDAAALAALDLPALGPSIEQHPLFPRRTNVSWFTATSAGTVRARIFERGVGETLASGTGATGAAIAHVLRGGDSSVTVHLDGGELMVDVGEDLHVDLTGWAVPVYAGTLDAALQVELKLV